MNENNIKKYQIGIFGRRNVGKSSIINSILGQQFAIVSDIPGTTTDPVRKRIELPEIGICTLIDTAGYDDNGVLGLQRVEKSMQIIDQIDLAILVINNNLFTDIDKAIYDKLYNKEIPIIIVHNKSDIYPISSETLEYLQTLPQSEIIEYSCLLRNGNELIRADLVSVMKRLLSYRESSEITILDGLVSPNDNIVLVCPIDSEAPHNRLILPQVLAIRDILDKNGNAIVLQPEQLTGYLANQPNVNLVVTDSQVFAIVSKMVPESIPLTSFSMLLARSKGLFYDYQKGISQIKQLEDNSKVLILESCTHHASCEDIGRVKLPKLIRKFTNKDVIFDIVNGLDAITTDLNEYSLVIQCGGCMVTKRQLYNRLKPAIDANIPVTNYGMAIAYMTGIYDRAITPLNKAL